MAYAALVSLSQLLDQILNPHQHSFVARREKKQVQSLHENIVFLSTFLEDFPTEAAKSEARITIAANQAEDIFEYHILKQKDSKYGKRPSNVLNCFLQVPLSPRISIFAGHNLKRLFKELREPIKEIDSISKEMMQIKSRCISENQISSHSSASFPSRLAPNVRGTVVGFEEELMKIKGRLFGEPSKLQVIPIVGMGGIGKTTLARYAHDDPSTLHHFDIRAWVTISQSYLIKRILLGLLYSIDASTKGLYDEDMCTETLLEHVYKYLKGRRYLIVVDDIWNANVWDDLRRAFPDDLNGSRIMITSRDLDVASYVGFSSHPHEMHLMGVDQSWDLLRQKVFGEEQCPPELEEIGKWIAEKCRGLPLAIVVIAGVLSKVDQMQGTWENIASNVNEVVNTSDEPFAEILSLSYAHLPHHLRPCFLYMGGFPEDHEIKVSKLVKLWAAEGFLKSNGSKDLEEMGEDYLEDLAKRSLVLINKKRYNGKIKTVKIHDLLRDLCLRKAHDEKFLHVICEFSVRNIRIEYSRRLSILSYTLGGFQNIDGSRLHTILLFHVQHFDCWESFRLLRVVDAMSVRMTWDTDAIGELLHLRYLAVTFEHEVPESWSKLENLQTLIIRSSTFVRPSYLPFGIWRMPQLRHLIIWDGFLTDPSGELLALENLHTLKGINCFTCSKRILELIPNLKKLGIVYSSGNINRTGWSKFGLKNLVHLHKLEKLNVYAFPHGYSQSNFSHNIAFPVTLKKLTLSGSGIPWQDMSIVGSLPNLQVLKLKIFACHGFEWITTEGEFCQLKQLLIDSTDPHEWITESSHFPRLECLRLYNCHMLTEIPCSIGEIPTLQLIDVDSCNLSIVESAKCIEEEHRSFGSDLKVHLKNSSPHMKSASVALDARALPSEEVYTSEQSMLSTTT